MARRQAELENYSNKKSRGKQPPPSEEGPEREQVIEAADLVSRISTFVGALSSHQGADLPDTERTVALDAARLLSELRRTLGMPAAGGGEEGSDEDDGDSSSEGSSFFSDGEEDDDEEEEDDEGDETGNGGRNAFAEELARQMGVSSSPVFSSQGVATAAAAAAFTGPPHDPHASWEVDTATDSDDDMSQGEGEDEEEEEDGLSLGAEGHPRQGTSGFFEAYSSALEEQLRDTRMAESFDRRTDPAAPSAPANKADSSSGGPEGASGVAAGGVLQPVDLDMNLVKSLLRSVAAQQGLAGPAGNLAGMLGINLPQGLEEKNLS